MKILKPLSSLSLIILLSLGATSAFAQDRFQAGGHFMLGYPQNEFKQNVGIQVWAATSISPIVSPGVSFRPGFHSAS
jgi:hypothetical protein